MNLITIYNQKVTSGLVDPKNHLSTQSEAQMKGLGISVTSTINATPSASATTTSSAVGTGGLPKSWFHLSSPEVVIFYYWRGNQIVFNEVATSETEGALWVISGIAGSGSAAAILAARYKVALELLAFIPDVDVILGLIVAGAATVAGTMQATDRGSGINYQYPVVPGVAVLPGFMTANVD